MKKLSLTFVAFAVFAVLGCGNVALAKSMHKSKHMMMTKNPCSKGHQLMSGDKIPIKGGGGGPVCGG